MAFAFGVISKKSLPRPMSRFSPMLSSRSFMVQVLFFFFFYNFYLFIYLWLCWVLVSVRGPSPAAAKRGPLFIAVRGPLTIAASPVAEHRLQTCRLSNCGSRGQLLHGMWGPPRPGLEPASPASAGRLSTTAPPGKPPGLMFKSLLHFRFL